ncbi:MAG: Gfo/Idh/MocA family oxidoreductase [Anaerolineaceae bacterium]|nr:Gfo/Idh/MocA family oxidoreductase [Anaerolineaceae bacterium]
MRFLIAGYGSIGRRHMRNLLAQGEKDILLFRTHKSTLPDDELDNFVVETDIQAALDHKPDAVIVANPTAYHLDVAIPAAKAGCHLLLEKPISHNYERLNILEGALRDNQSHALVGFQFRYHPGLQQIKDLLDEGEIGKPVSVHAHWGEYLPGWHPWEDYRKSYSAREDLGGGVVLTLSHPLDYLRWLLGEVDTVWAFTQKISDLEMQVEAVAEIGLQFSQGTIGSLHLNYIQQPSTHRLEIVGTRGTIRWDNSDGVTRLFKPDSTKWISFPLPEGFERNDLFLSEINHFIKVIQGKEEPVCTLEDGKRALKLAIAVHKSAQYGKLIRF